MKVKKGNKKNSKPIKKSRKEIRKDNRKQKKIKRAEYYKKKYEGPDKTVSNLDNNKINKQNENKSNKKQIVSTDELILKKINDEKKQQERLSKQNKKKHKLQLIKDNEIEDRKIKQLEKKLNLDKPKIKNTPKKSFTDDGLDYLLDFCDPESRKIAVETEKHLMGADIEEDFEEDFAMMTGLCKDDDDDDVESDEDEQDLEESNASDDNEPSPASKKHSSKVERITLTKKQSNKQIESDEDEEFNFGSDDDNDKEDLEESNVSDDNEPSPISKKRPAKVEKIKPLKKQKVEQKKNPSKQIKSDEDEDFNFDSDGSDVDMKDVDDELDNDNESASIKKNDDGTWEDIYGRKRDKDGNVITETSTGKYIPPAARLKLLENTTTQSEKFIRLRKQLKGLINRLAEHNIHSISNQIEELYMSNSRNDMNELLVKLMMESIVAPVLTTDRLIAEHMMLIAILHANIGTEVGAHFLLKIVKKFNDMINEYNEVENKELDNIILMISHLYNFKVYGSQLLYQILDILTTKFNDKEIELILLVLKTVGFLLRKDDPVSLKELIIKLQQKASTSNNKNTRIQFMLETLMAIKNNNMSKLAQYDPTHIEHLKKMLKTYLRKGNSVTQFNISLNDLLNVDERGKWWIVGSAWTGNIDNSNINNNNDNNKLINNNETIFSQKILDLADKQRMKGIKKDIFCILMTAEDYMDAFEKLHCFQAKDVIPVIINCCIQEKKFNLYYALLTNKLCDYDKKNKRQFGYQLKDGIKNKFIILEEYKNIQIHNLAEFCAYLIIEKTITLTILKDIEFTELDKPTMRFIRQLMIGILLNDNIESCIEAFERISKSPDLKSLRDGLRFFISCFLIKNIDSKNLPDNYVRKLKERSDIVEKILLTRSGRITF